MFRLAFPAALAAVAARGAALSTTPLEKVVALLDKLKTDVEAEGVAEAKTYDEFACFCKEKSSFVSQNILAGQDSIEVLSANLGELTATKETRQSELAAKQQEEEELKRSLSETEIMLEKERATYDASDADLTKAISSLEGSIAALEKSKGAPSASGLLSLRSSIQKSLELADAMKLLDDGPKWHNAIALLQKVDPNSPDYGFHSQGIIKILNELQEQFKRRKSEADDEWAKTKSTLEQTIADLNNQLTLAAAAIVELTTTIDKLTSDIATTRASLVESESALKEDQLYMNDLTKLCEARAKEWDQRSQARHDELEALAQALAIIKGEVTEAESVNQRALLQQHQGANSAAPHKAPASFVQLRAVRAHGGTLLERSRAAKQLKEKQVVASALAVLRKEGARLGSSALAGLAARVAEDPFNKVKNLIQDLIERLLEEATAEATKKSFCDTEVGKATQDRTFRFEAAQKLNAELRQLEAKRDALAISISDLRSAIETLTAALAEATAARAAEKEENAATIKTANEGLKAVSTALLILKDFYKQAAKAKVALLQASPVDQDLPSAANGAYKGQQEASTGIIGLLEVIKSDFERTVDRTTKAEALAAAQFVEFERNSKADLSSKTTKVELNEQDLETTESKISIKTKDLKSNVNLLDQALRELEELKPMCTDNGMSYEERVQKREEEIVALKKAVCILDTDGAEDMCK